MKHLILIISMAAPTFGFAEEMTCSTSEYIGYTTEKGLEKYDIKADDKSYISITENILAINTSDTAAKLYKQNGTYSSGILGLINRKFVATDEFATDVVIVGGKECAFGDAEIRTVNRSVTFTDAIYSQLLSCECN